MKAIEKESTPFTALNCFLNLYIAQNSSFVSNFKFKLLEIFLGLESVHTMKYLWYHSRIRNSLICLVGNCTEVVVNTEAVNTIQPTVRLMVITQPPIDTDMKVFVNQTV